MKKRIIMMIMGLMALAMIGCTKSIESENMENGTEIDRPAEEGEGLEGLPTPEVDEWGVSFSVKDVTLTGLTIVCTQEGGAPTGELTTGSYYVVEKLYGDKWAEAVRVPQEYEVGWTMEAWLIPTNATSEWEVDWEWLYGKLSAGQYRIGKELMDFRGNGDYDQKMYYAEFEIE